jgi:hypothetical protein
VDSSVHIFGLRLNMYVAIILTITGALWFYRSQRRRDAQPADPAPEPGVAEGPNAEDPNAEDPNAQGPNAGVRDGRA